MECVAPELSFMGNGKRLKSLRLLNSGSGIECDTDVCVCVCVCVCVGGVYVCVCVTLCVPLGVCGWV